MSGIMRWLDCKLGAPSEGCDGEHSSNGSSKHGPESGVSHKSQRPGGQKRQRRRHDDDSSGQEDERGNDGEGGEKKRPRMDSDNNRLRFACPFFKHSRGKHIRKRSCCGPGFVSIHRLK
jgi:hypothetical protein